MWWRKVNSTHMHSKICDDYHEYFTHNNGAWKHNIDVATLVNGFYQITAESIKLILNIKQFGTGSNSIITTYHVQNLFLCLLHILINTIHAFHRKTFEYYSAMNSPSSVKLALTILCCLLYLQHNFWFKLASFVAAEMSTTQMYQLLFPCFSWDKYHHTYTLYGWDGMDNMGWS